MASAAASGTTSDVALQNDITYGMSQENTRPCSSSTPVSAGEEATGEGSAAAEGAAPSRYSPDLSPSRYSLDSEVEDEARGSDGEPAPKKGKFAAAGASQPGAESDVDDNDGSFYVV